MHVMRYENIVADPLAAFSEVVGFIHIQTIPDAIARAVRHADFKEAAAMERATGFKERTPAQERFFRSGMTDQLRAVLNPDQVAAVIKAYRK